MDDQTMDPMGPEVNPEAVPATEEGAEGTMEVPAEEEAAPESEE